MKTLRRATPRKRTQLSEPMPTARRSPVPDPAPAPGQWTPGVNEAGWLSEVRDENGETVCSCNGTADEAEARAARIVSAVNWLRAMAERKRRLADPDRDVRELRE